MIAELHRRGEPWNSYALVARILTEDTGYQGMCMGGYRYVTGKLPAMDTISGRNLFDLLLALRADTPAPTGEAWEVAILRIDGDNGLFAIEFVFPDAAAQWQISPVTFREIADAARPRSEHFA